MHDPLRISLKHDHEPHATAAPVRRHVTGRRVPVMALTMIGIILAGIGWGSYRLFAAVAGSIPAASSAAAVRSAVPGDTQSVVAKVGAIMLLPQNETPTIAVVSDLSKLKGQTFFMHASEGDFVLMYPRASRAILWNPTLNKIIEVAPIVNDQPQTP